MTRLPALRLGELASVVDLGVTPPCELFLTADGSTSPSSSTRCTCGSARSCLLVQLPAYIPPEDIFTDYAYFSSYSDSWVRARGEFVDARRRAARARTLTRSSSRSRATTATCCSTRRAAGIRSLGIEPAANVAEAAVASGAADRGDVPRRARPARRSPPSTARPTWSWRTTCSRTCPTSSTSARACAALVADDGRRQHRDPAPAAADRGQRVRHDLPRALLLHSRCSTTQRVLAAAGLPWSTSRSCRPTAARCAPGRCPSEARGEPTDAVAEVLAAEEAAGLHTLEGHDGFAGGVARSATTSWSSCRRAERGQEGGRLRRAGQGQHAAQPLRHPQRPARVQRRPQPAQARHVPAGHAHPDPAARGAGRGPARLRADHARGTCARRSPSSSRYVREWGGQLVVALPELEIFDHEGRRHEGRAVLRRAGMRMRAGNQSLPKPMMPIGSRRCSGT